MRLKLLLILFIGLSAKSQNLVKNPSFEQVEKCAHRVSQFQQNVKHWTIPTNGTTDLFNTCSKGETGIPANFSGYQEVQFENNYVGCYFYSGNNYREYIQGEFLKPLEQGKRYRFSVYISLADYSNMAVKEIGLLLTSQKFKEDVEHTLSPENFKAQNFAYQIVTIESNGFYEDKNQWTYVSTEFTANGGENFITVGNFEINSRTKKKQVIREGALNDTSYYYLDQVAVELVSESEFPESTVMNPAPNETTDLNEAFLLHNIEFDYDSSLLRPTEKITLKKLHDYLKINSSFSLKITGHTDGAGSVEYNQLLSVRRANSVAAYLNGLGLSKNRIQSLGFGLTQPLSKNNNFVGRQRNRRVEFELIRISTF